MSISENVGNKQLAVHCLVIALAGKRLRLWFFVISSFPPTEFPPARIRIPAGPHMATGGMAYGSRRELPLVVA